MGFLDDVFDSVLPEVFDALSDTDVTLTLDGRTYDPLSGFSGSASQATLKATPFDSYSVDEIDNTQVQRSDLKTIVAAADLGSFVIQANGTRLTRGGKTFIIVSVTPIHAGDRAVAFELQCRGAA